MMLGDWRALENNKVIKFAVIYQATLQSDMRKTITMMYNRMVSERNLDTGGDELYTFALEGLPPC